MPISEAMSLVELAGTQCHPVRRRAWVQLARPAQAVRQLAHHLHAHESLGQVWRPGQSLRATTARASGADQDRSRVVGQHQRQGASRWHRGSKKNGPQAIGKSRGGWNTKIHLLAADARTAVTFSLSPGQAHDAPEGRELLRRLGAPNRPLHLLMDRAYEGNETRQLALDLGFIPVVPPLRTRVEPWEYDPPCTSAAMKSSACSVGSRAIGALSRSRSWTSCHRLHQLRLIAEARVCYRP